MRISPGLYRAGFAAHCYWMLGPVHDADDAVQVTLLRASREGRPRDARSVRSAHRRTFVNSPIEALELAAAAAGDKDVDVFSANIGQQLLRAGRIDVAWQPHWPRMGLRGHR